MKKTNKKSLIAAAIFAVVVIVLAICYFTFKPAASAGAKALTISVTDDQGATTEYAVQTDAEYLRQAMEETEGLEFSGTESDYGLMVETVNGVTADYNVDGAYWAFYVNDEYCQYGVDEQPVNDGEAYAIVYTK